MLCMGAVRQKIPLTILTEFILTFNSRSMLQMWAYKKLVLGIWKYLSRSEVDTKCNFFSQLKNSTNIKVLERSYLLVLTACRKCVTFNLMMCLIWWPQLDGQHNTMYGSDPSKFVRWDTQHRLTCRGQGKLQPPLTFHYYVIILKLRRKKLQM